MKTRVTELLGIEVPVIQGAMARIANASLAGAVSKAGGLGIIACGGAPLEWIEEQVSLAVRSMTDKPIGANVMLMDPNAAEVAKLLADLRVDVIATGAGSPANYMEMWKEAGIKVVPVVASTALAVRMERLGSRRGGGRRHRVGRPHRRAHDRWRWCRPCATRCPSPSSRRAALPTAAAWRPRSRWAPKACSWERASSRWRNALLPMPTRSACSRRRTPTPS